MYVYAVYRAIRHVVDALTPYTKENGGPITIRHITYVEGRGNLIIEYKKVGELATIAAIPYNYRYSI